MSEKEQLEYKKETNKRPMYFNKPSNEFKEWLKKREKTSENEKILIDFNKMNKIGKEPVTKINNRIISILEERHEFVKIRDKEIINHIIGWGNIVIENKDEIIKRNKELIEYVISGCGLILFDTDKEKIKRYKKFKEIRNQGKKDYCLNTDKQMINRYDKIMKIDHECYEDFNTYVNENILHYNTFKHDQMNAWINAYIETNGIEKMLEIYERDQYFYEYLLEWQEGITNEHDDRWFFNREVKSMLNASWS